jgi:pimeloyl-ACP methyl ester carboxylesterase
MRFARSGDAKIAYDVVGAGARVILLISPLAGTIDLWGAFRDQLAEHARVIAYDHRGLGASSAAPMSVSTRAMARDALAVLDDAGIDRADVFGISLGGMVATWLAADAPARVGRLVLASTLARGIELATSARSVLRGARLATCAVRGHAALGGCLADGILTDAFEAAHPDEADRIARAISDAPRSRRSVLVLAGAAARHDARAALPRITAPTLVLAGELDTLVAPERQRRDFASLRDAHFDVIAGAGHALALEAPADVADRVLAFSR